MINARLILLPFCDYPEKENCEFYKDDGSGFCGNFNSQLHLCKSKELTAKMHSDFIKEEECPRCGAKQPK